MATKKQPKPGATVSRKTVTLSFEVSDEFASDVLNTAIEGGSNYWAMIGKRQNDNDDILQTLRSVRIDEYGDEDKAVSRKTITLPMIREGIRRILAGDMNRTEKHANVGSHLRGRLYLAVATNDAGEFDGELADVVMQAAYFGHIVYG